MKKILRVTNKTILLTAVIGSLLVMTMVMANSIWSAKQTLSATDEAVSTVSTFYLETMADRRAKTVTTQIDSEFSQMEKALSFIEEEKIDSQEELRKTLGKVEELLSLNQLALVDEENIVYTKYTSYTGRSRHPFLSEKKMEDRIINTVSLYGSSKQLCLAIPTPGLTIMGKTFKACFVQIDMKDIIELLGIDEQDRTYFAIYAKTGGNLSGTELGPVIGEHNFLDATKHLLPEDIWEDNENRFERGEKGNMDFSVKGIKETLCYAPVKGTGWELAVLIRESVILEQIRAISNRNLATSRNQIIFTLVALILLSVILLLEIKTLSKEKLEEQKEASRAFRDMATKDSLTGVRNKHAYSECEVVLDQRIQAGEIQKLAMVVCDINGLKIVNDTQGHAAGDQLIKDACAMICKYFNHGAVFRIGGDEFVVILQGVGFDTMTDVMDDLNHRFEENIQEDGVVVAMGSSVLKPEDQRLQDVFDRADAMMYERKKELKSVGAKTRAL